MEIRKATILGSGYMGLGIAAHLASRGIPVRVLDLKSESGDHNAVSACGLGLVQGLVGCLNQVFG